VVAAAALVALECELGVGCAVRSPKEVAVDLALLERDGPELLLVVAAGFGVEDKGLDHGDRQLEEAGPLRVFDVVALYLGEVDTALV